MFPDGLSTSVSRLRYPDFKTTPFRAYVYHLNERRKVCFKPLTVQQAVCRHMLRLAERCKSFNGDVVERPWCAMERILMRPPLPEHRNNLDRRAVYRFSGNTFLVAPTFSFGQRTVERGTQHVIQLLEVPLAIYHHTTLQRRDGALENQERYCQTYLRPHQNYRVPAGTVYVLYAIHVCLFALDIVPEDEEMSFVCVDPITSRMLPDSSANRIESPGPADTTTPEL